jgi:hypothetical protein
VQRGAAHASAMVRRQSSKHAELHSFVPQASAASASTTGVMQMSLPKLATFNIDFEGATIQDIEYLVVGGA